MLKTLGRETKGFRLVSVLTPIFMIAEVIMEMIIPKLMASIIDNGVTPGNMQVIYTVGAQMVVAALFGLPRGHGLCPQPAPRHVPQHPDLQLCQH